MIEQQTEETKPEQRKRTESERQASRLRGARRGLLARYALRSLPPVTEDEP